MVKEEEGFLKVIVEKKGNFILCLIDDKNVNGNATGTTVIVSFKRINR